MTMITDQAGLAWYHYPRQYQQLLSNTAGHEMRIIHADGLYRHLRFAKPGTGIWSWDIVTWPGRLAIVGDIGEGFIFTREDDMLAFFDNGQPDGHINAQYWAEKLSRGARSVLEFSEWKFWRWLEDQVGTERKRDIDDGTTPVDTIDQAVALLEECNIYWDCDDPDSWRDYEWHYLLACHAILWGAKRYHAEVRS